MRYVPTPLELMKLLSALKGVPGWEVPGGARLNSETLYIYKLVLVELDIE